MAERQATVIEIIAPAHPGGVALVRLEFEAAGGCGRCHETGGCGGVSLAQPLCAKPKSLVLPDPIGLSVGETVRVTIPDALLSKGVTHTYVIPLILFFAGSILGATVLPSVLPLQWQVSSDVGAMLGAGIGLVAAWWQLQRNQRKSPISGPQILERF